MEDWENKGDGVKRQKHFLDNRTNEMQLFGVSVEG
jgi:hypothetical protein